MDLLPLDVATVQTLKAFRARVSREDAVKTFDSRGLRRWSVARHLNPLRSIAELYLPFRIYRVCICRGDALDTRYMGLDLLSGNLDPFTFDSQPSDSDTHPVVSKNHLPPVLDDATAEHILTTKIQRILFQSGFFRIKDLDIQLEPMIECLHMPYWVGFFGAKETASIQILDATRRVIEGNKLRRSVYEWLTIGCTDSGGRTVPAGNV